MPRSAVEHVAVDHVARLADIPRLIARLASEPFTAGPSPRSTAVSELNGEEPGLPVDIVCPQCQGALSVSELNGFQLFRCHLGHTFSLEGLADEQAEEVERAL
jgi:two-component system chemotaxis response regulator CheB